MSNRAAAELRKAIADGEALIVCGLGVSIYTNRKAPTWRGLIKSGVEEAAGRERAPNQEAGWSKGALEILRDDDVTGWLSVADLFSTKLKAPSGGPFRSWLRREIGDLPIVNPELLRAIRSLGCPTATTNYDGFLCKPLSVDQPSLDPILWNAPEKVLEFLKEDRPGILHLHGHWDFPESVVLGQRSYDRIVGNDRAQFLQQVASLNYKLVFIGCGHDGLSDDNIGSLLTWFGKDWSELRHEHFVLVRDADASAAWPPSIRPVPYGADYRELPAFVTTLAPPKAKPGAEERGHFTATDSSSGFQTIDRVFPKGECYGREKEIQAVVKAILDGRTPVAVRGGPGMGKTTIAVNALYDSKVNDKFGHRRAFVTLESAREPHAILTSVAAAMGLPTTVSSESAKGLPTTGDGPQLLSLIEKSCREAPVVAVLDHINTPRAHDPDETTQKIGLLAQIKGLALVLTDRGTAGFLHQKTTIPNLQPLSLDAAKRAFLAIAGDYFRNDKNLDALLQEVQGHPLSIALLAAKAQGLSSLNNLHLAFRDLRSQLLETGGTRDRNRLTSIRASLRMSLNDPDMTDKAKRLFGLLALFPNGMSYQISDSLIEDAASPRLTLIQLGLAFDRGDNRLWVLAPLRAAAGDECPVDGADEEKMLAQMLALASEGQKIATPDWAAVADRVMPEIDNFDPILSYCIRRGRPWEGVNEPLLGLVELHRFTGLGSVSALDTAMRRYKDNREAQARLRFRSGVVALERSDYRAAQSALERARDLFQELGIVLGSAFSLKQLASLAERRSDFPAARSLFEQARALFERIDHKSGQASCIMNLGQLALVRSDYDAACSAFVEATRLHRQHPPDRLGEANCIIRLGQVLLRLSQQELAEAAFAKAQELYRGISDAGGEANCIQSLAQLALQRMQLEEAAVGFETALQVHRKIRDLLGLVGQAGCIRGLGSIAFLKGERRKAGEAYDEALTLYRQTGDILGEANCAMCLGDLAFAEKSFPSARKHYESARDLYQKIGGLIGEASAEWRGGEIAQARPAAGKSMQHFARAMALRRGLVSDRALPGWEALLRAKQAASRAAGKIWLARARRRWAKVGRRDLIADFIDFPPAAATG